MSKVKASEPWEAGKTLPIWVRFGTGKAFLLQNSVISPIANHKAQLGPKRGVFIGGNMTRIPEPKAGPSEALSLWGVGELKVNHGTTRWQLGAHSFGNEVAAASGTGWCIDWTHNGVAALFCPASVVH